MTSTLYRAEIECAASAHRLDANLLEALVICESSGQADAFRFEPDYWKRYCARNPKFAGQNPRRIASSYGLCQIMFPTALQHDYPYPEPEYLFVPVINLEFGCRHFGWCLEWADGDVLKALAAYNGGTGNWMGTAPQAYSRRVNAKLEEIQQVRRI